MKSIWMIALLAGSVRAADVTIFMTGDAPVPASVITVARGQVTRMFVQIGVHLAWHDGEPADKSLSEGSAIQVTFTTATSDHSHPGALAFAQPFAKGVPGVWVMYDRLQFAVTQQPRLEPTVLAHVLAHEIGHILLGSNAHADGGVMKAHWTSRELCDMGRKPLGFTPTDKQLIAERLQRSELAR